MLIWRKDAAIVCRMAATKLAGLPFSDAIEEGMCNDLAMKLRQLATSLDHGGPVGPLGEIPAGERITPGSVLSGPVNEYEAAHRTYAVGLLKLSGLGHDDAERAVGHVIEAAAHRVMAQVIGAIEKTRPPRPSLGDIDAAASEARRRMAQAMKRANPAPKPKNGRRRRKGAPRGRR
jgi:hypothetical protein